MCPLTRCDSGTDSKVSNAGGKVWMEEDMGGKAASFRRAPLMLVFTWRRQRIQVFFK